MIMLYFVHCLYLVFYIILFLFLIPYSILNYYLAFYCIFYLMTTKMFLLFCIYITFYVGILWGKCFQMNTTDEQLLSPGSKKMCIMFWANVRNNRVIKIFFFIKTKTKSYNFCS